MKTFIRKLHRWLGLLMAIQIIAWMASGLYFSLIPITEIRGEHLTRPVESVAPGQLAGLLQPGSLKRLFDEEIGTGWSLDSLRTISMGGKAYWRVEGERDGEPFRRLVAADGGSIVSRLSEDQAAAVAANWLRQPVEPVAVAWVETAEAGSEYRGRDLPLWRVDFTGPEPVSLYLDPWTGELLARRTDRWRIFDFLWMLHIMDFDTRDDFNHPLLQIAAALGLIIGLSGVVFWTMTTKLFRRRRLIPAPTE